MDSGHLRISDDNEQQKKGEEIGIDNIYCCTEAEKFVFKTFVRLPMWSNVMCEKFKSTNFTPTSSASENEFKNIKRLMGIETHRVHVFVNSHLEQLSGILKLASANTISTDGTSTDSGAIDGQDRKLRRNARKIRSSSFSEHSVDSILLTHDRSRSLNDVNDDVSDTIQKECEENWKGRNRNPSMLRRSRKSILNPHDIDYVCQDIPLLRNGYTSKSRKANQKSIIVTNTCAMDSVFAIYCAAYLDNKVTKNYINDSTEEDSFSFFVKTIFTSKTKSTTHYENRTELLMRIFTKKNYRRQIKEDKHTITVSCKTGLAGFFEKLSKQDNERIASIERTNECTECSYTYVSYSVLMPMYVSIHGDVDLINIERYITMNDDIVFSCRKCGNNSIITQRVNNIIAFEVEPLVRKRKKQYTISQLKENISVHGESYTLFGLIEYISTIEHFVAYVKRNNGVWQSIDDLKNEIESSKRITSTPLYISMLFYVKNEK